jgi:hypothetical protein
MAYELGIFFFIVGITSIVLFIEKDDTFIYFASLIGLVALAFYISQATYSGLFPISGFVSGLILASLARDELNIGKPWIVGLACVSAVGGVVSWILGEKILTQMSLYMICAIIPSLFPLVLLGKRKI